MLSHFFDNGYTLHKMYANFLLFGLHNNLEYSAILIIPENTVNNNVRYVYHD